MPGPHALTVRHTAARLARRSRPLTNCFALRSHAHTTSSRPPHPASRFVTTAIRPLCRGGIRESIVVICPTAPAADWHDGQIAHEAHAKFARRAVWASRPGYGQPLREGAAPAANVRALAGFFFLLRSRQITHTETESRANRAVERSCRIAVRHHWRTTLTGVVSGRHATRQQQNCRPDSLCWGSVNI